MRLIDADAFESYVRKHCKDSLADLWCELIRRQPTACDPDKMIEQIKQSVNVELIDDDYYLCTGRQLKAITTPVLEKIIRGELTDE